MSNTVRVLHQSFLPGAGQDTSGNPKQGKQEVRGRIVVDSYAKGGETLAAADLGLEKVDFLSLSVVDPIKSPGKAPRHAAWSETNSQFYVFDHVADNAVPDGAVHEVASGTAVTVAFNAFGDSLLAPELR